MPCGLEAPRPGGPFGEGTILQATKPKGKETRVESRVIAAVRGDVEVNPLRVIGVLLAPAAPLAVGVVTMRGGDVPTGIWVLNLAAAAVGVSIAAFALMWRRQATPFRESLRWGALLAGVALLGATLVGQGTEGVHRWLPLGPVQVHVGAVLLPPMLVALLESSWRAAVGGAFVALVLLLLQPDAAQAASFCAAWIVIAAFRRGRRATAVMVVSLLLALACVLRPDPLEPVPHVEGIVGMAAAGGPALAVAALLSLAVLPLAQALFLERQVGLVLAIYTAGLLVAAWLGHHPVPVLGYGVSPILGYYFAVTMAVLLGRYGRDTSGQTPTAVA